MFGCEFRQLEIQANKISFGRRERKKNEVKITGNSQQSLMSTGKFLFHSLQMNGIKTKSK